MPESTKNVLFVDDDPEIISSTRRFLHMKRQDWQVTFAASGGEALLRLKERTYDVVISDIRMPGMSGIDLLQYVRAQYPQAVRIALSGHADRESSLKISGLAHQYLVKPCPIEDIITTIQQTLSASAFILNENLRNLMARLRTIPSQPRTYLEIMEELRKPEPSIGHVSDIISRDASMSTKILQLVNSPFFGLTRTIINPGQAAMFLGTETLRDLVLTIGVFAQFDSGKMQRLKLSNLWDHCQRTGQLAKAIAVRLNGSAKQLNEAFVSGLIHDVGKLILADNFPQQYIEINWQASAERREIQVVEQHIFGTDHAQVGAYLFGLWGLSPTVQNTVAGHHNPIAALPADRLVLLAVHAANAIDYLVNDKQLIAGRSPSYQLDFIRACGVESELDTWKQLAIQQT